MKWEKKVKGLLRHVRERFASFRCGKQHRMMGFQCDDAAIHSRNETKAWSATHNVPFMPLPSKKGDLTSKENLRKVSPRRVYKGKRQFESFAALNC